MMPGELRCATESFAWVGTLDGVRIASVSGRCLAGTGRLSITAAGVCAWAEPGAGRVAGQIPAPPGTSGPGVDVSAGGYYVLPGVDPDCWCRVHVTADRLPGAARSADVRLTVWPDGPIAGADVTAAQAAAGDVSTWHVDLVNTALSDDVVAAVWLDPVGAWQSYELSSDGSTWSRPTAPGTLALSINHGSFASLYLRRTITAGAARRAGWPLIVRWLTSGDFVEAGAVRGALRVWAAGGAAIYARRGAAPLGVPAEIIGTLASVPGSIERELMDGAQYLAAAADNGVYRGGIGAVVRMEVVAGAVVVAAPRQPTAVSLEALPAGAVRVRAAYAGTSDSAATRANRWQIWLATGTTPSWPASPTATRTMYSRGAVQLVYDHASAYSDGDIVWARVATARSGDGGASEPVTVGPITISVPTPAAPTVHGTRPGGG